MIAVCRLTVVGLFASIVLACAFHTARAAETEHEQFFHEQVAPILTANCMECHNKNTRKGGLSLETLADALAGGDEGAAVVPGKLAESLLIGKVVASAPGEVPEMPQKKPPLSAADVEKLKRWITDGAAWPKTIVLKEKAKADKSWWSLQPLATIEPPHIEQVPAHLPKSWQTHPIDRFVWAKLAEHELQPNPPASPQDLIRRVTYDLTGLPPTAQEVATFVAEWELGDENTRENVYSRFVDTLLASPR